MKLNTITVPVCLLAIGIFGGCSGLSSQKGSEQSESEMLQNSDERVTMESSSDSMNSTEKSTKSDPPSFPEMQNKEVESASDEPETIQANVENAVESTKSKESDPPKVSDSIERVKPAAVKPDTMAHDRVTKSYDSSSSQKILNVDKLLNTSSMAKQIITSGNQNALLLHEQALSELDLAKKADKKGDEAAMNTSLANAKKLMFQAVRATGTSQSVLDKRLDDCEKKFNSAKSMLEAHKRVSKEKGATKETAKTEAHVAQMLKKADEYCKNNRVSEARKIVDDAFLTTKLSLTQMRSGDTLVRSLNFATKEDEYNYEIDRNNSHQMLVTVLLKEKMSSPSIAKNVEENMVKAKTLRTQAEGEAKKGDYEKAIKTLELSTKQIFRAIRSAGIFIPG